MSEPGPANWTLAPLLLAAGGWLSAAALRRLAARRPEAPPPPPFPRLTGYDVLTSLVLILLFPLALARFYPGDLLELGFLPLLALNLAMLLLVCAFLRWRAGPGGPWRSSAAHLPWAAAAYLCALPALIAVLYLNTLLVALFTGAGPAQTVRDALVMADGAQLWLALPLAVAAQPAAEELLFRGYLQRFLAAHPGYGPGRALFLSAALFAVVHEPAVALPIFACGLLFGWIYRRTASLPAAMLVHALHNGLATLVLLQSDPPASA